MTRFHDCFSHLVFMMSFSDHFLRPFFAMGFCRTMTMDYPNNYMGNMCQSKLTKQQFAGDLWQLSGFCARDTGFIVAFFWFITFPADSTMCCSQLEVVQITACTACSYSLFLCSFQLVLIVLVCFRD